MYVSPALRGLTPGIVGFRRDTHTHTAGPPSCVHGRSHREMWSLDASRMELPDGARPGVRHAAAPGKLASGAAASKAHEKEAPARPGPGTHGAITLNADSYKK